MLRALAAAFTLLSLAAPIQAQAAPITVFVVRHAEKGPENPDPSLTAVGQARAAALARILADAKVTALFSSEFKRTRETVAPLGTAVGVTPTVVPAVDMDGLVAKLRALPPGSRALVASHSNLVHLIVEKLSGVKVPALTEADYDRLVVVTFTGDGKGDALVLKYDDK
jgi:broad specificity phosphatase PhoE